MPPATPVQRTIAGSSIGLRDLTEHRWTVSLVGKLDLATAPRARQVLAKVLQLGGGTVAVDLSELAFIDAAGMRVLLEAYKVARRQGRAILLVGAAPRTLRLLKVLRLGEMIEGYADQSEALVVPVAGALNARDGNGRSLGELGPFRANGVTWIPTA
jgi:anti-sigma B factor antagonist